MFGLYLLHHLHVPTCQPLFCGCYSYSLHKRTSGCWSGFQSSHVLGPFHQNKLVGVCGFVFGPRLKPYAPKILLHLVAHYPTHHHFWVKWISNPNSANIPQCWKLSIPNCWCFKALPYKHSNTNIHGATGVAAEASASRPWELCFSMAIAWCFIGFIGSPGMSRSFLFHQNLPLEEQIPWSSENHPDPFSMFLAVVSSRYSRRAYKP